MLALDREAAFEPSRAEEILASLPERPAIVRIDARPELTPARPLLFRTANLRRRLRLLLGPPEAAGRRVNLREYAARIQFRVVGSRFEQTLVHWQHARVLWPQVYRQRLRMRPSALLKLNLANPYPRVYVTRRIGPSGLYFGPFASRRAADSFLESFLDFFRIRRCQIKIRRDPAFPGCIYSEMKMCMAPCFAGCTDQEYAAESRRVADFLHSRGESLAEQLAQEREAASQQLDFEQAAARHRRLEKVDAVRHGLSELARPLDELNALVLQRSAEENAVAVFIVRAGRIADPIPLHFGHLASQPRSVEQILRDALEGSPELTTARGEINARESEDHVALLGGWFYAQPREGEIFFDIPKSGGWPYRRILRACARLLAPPEAGTPASV